MAERCLPMVAAWAASPILGSVPTPPRAKKTERAPVVGRIPVSCRCQRRWEGRRVLSVAPPSHYRSTSNPGLEVLRYWDGVGTGRRGEAGEESGRKWRADGRLPRCGTSWLRWVPAWAWAAWAGERVPRPEVQVATRFREPKILTAWPQLWDVARPKAGEDARVLPTLSLPVCRRRRAQDRFLLCL